MIFFNTKVVMFLKFIVVRPLDSFLWNGTWYFAIDYWLINTKFRNNVLFNLPEGGRIDFNNTILLLYNIYNYYIPFTLTFDYKITDITW